LFWDFINENYGLINNWINLIVGATSLWFSFYMMSLLFYYRFSFHVNNMIRLISAVSYFLGSKYLVSVFETDNYWQKIITEVMSNSAKITFFIGIIYLVSNRKKIFSAITVKSNI
jgi:hypothetical protein